MSGHLIGCVAKIAGVGKSHKLALVAFADSADDRTHIGFPGYEGVQTWADCSRSRAAELIADLVTAGLLRLHKSARPGRRAEYVVFPNGCCDEHRTPDLDGRDHLAPAALIAAMQAAGVPLTPEQVAHLNDTGNGSEISDPSTLNGSEKSDPSPNGSGNGSEVSDPSGERVQNGSEISDPSTTTTTTPPSPRKRGAIVGGLSCPRHHANPVDNCRGCGTTARQIAEQQQRAATERRRHADQVAFDADRERRRSAVPLPSDLKVATRQAIRTNQRRTQ